MDVSINLLIADTNYNFNKYTSLIEHTIYKFNLFQLYLEFNLNFQFLGNIQELPYFQPNSFFYIIEDNLIMF